MRLYAVGFDFLYPYFEDTECFVPRAADADAIITMNQAGDWREVTPLARAVADEYNVPLLYYTIEDPNSYRFTLPQARLADYVFTSDGALIEQYRRDLRHERIFWLPLAASDKYHHPLPLADDATDFVFSGNFYPNQAREWATETILLPIIRAGYSLTIFSYPVNPHMPEELRSFVRGDGGGCRNVAEQYTHGRIVLGANNQRSGMDGHEYTVMTSMRTFEALACGKPFLASWSSAYKALGLVCYRYRHEYLTPERTPVYRGELAWSETPARTLDLAAAILSNDHGIGERGRLFVMSLHTYMHRMKRIERAIRGKAAPEEWR